MKRTLLPAVLTLALGTGLALAQAPIVRQTPDQQQVPAAQQQDPNAPPVGHAHHPHDPNKEAARLAKQLNLTPDQQAKLAGAFADRDQKVQAVQANTALAPQDVKQQMRAIHKDSEGQIAGILTPDQLQQMKAMRKEHGPHGQGQPQPQPAPPTA